MFTDATRGASDFRG